MAINRSLMERQLRMGGGIMNIQPRQQYGLGSFVKKAVKGVTGAVKKIAGSELGKAALIGAGMYGLGGGFGAGFQFGNIPGFTAAKNFMVGTGLPIGPRGPASGGIFGAAKNFLKSPIGLYGAITAASALAAAGVPEDQVPNDPGALQSYLKSGYLKLNPNLDYSNEEDRVIVDNFVQENSVEGMAEGGRIGYGGGSGDMILPMRKPGIEEMMSSNPGAAESGNPISRNDPIADLIDKYNLYKKVGPGVADETKTYLIEDFKESLENSGISIEEFNMRLQEQNEMDEPVDMAYGGRMGYAGGTDFENYLKGREQFEREQSEEQLYREYIEDIRRQKIAEQRNMAAYGGRMGYAFGTPENNAIQAAQMEGLPLNQNPAGVTELDLRDSGGFIPPVGVKEKADDIPAMLANNEFVFTADAVRGMGEGNVNKGAQRMYDMMKKLEKGGRV
jgi:hypothetical protein